MPDDGPMTPRERLAAAPLWLFLPSFVALVLLNAAGVIGPGWMVGLMVASWAAILVLTWWLARPATGKENGDA